MKNKKESVFNSTNLFDLEEQKTAEEKKQVTGRKKVAKTKYSIYLTDEERLKIETIANRKASSFTQVIRDMVNAYEI